MDQTKMVAAWLKKCTLVLALFATLAAAFNGELAELECPDDCDCHYFRINWVTDCSDSNLTEIPYSELSLNVYYLDMNGNRISEVTPFPPDIKMRRLQLAHNLMTELNKTSFAGLVYLLDADFSWNFITKVDPDTFEDSAGLITLELQGNPLEAVDGPFLSSRSLMYLDISECGLTYLNPYFFVNTTALTTLIMSNNPIGGICNEVFEPLASLETLKLNNCNLSHIAEGAFDSQTSLKVLELAGNYLTNINWYSVLNSVVRLEYLDVRNSEIIHLPENTFANSTWIRTLILAENELRNLDVEGTLGQNLGQLDTLDLSNCKLKSTSLSADAFTKAVKLRTLYLSGNSLQMVDLTSTLAPLIKLQKLSLRNCGLRQLPDVFDTFKNLQELDISHNPLDDAFTNLLEPLESLEYLNMGYSNLSYISPYTFSKMTSMKRLILSGNDLNSLEAGLFGNLTHLESLELNFCGLRRPLNATVFFNNLTYTDLTELQLAGNPLIVSPTGPLFPKQLSRLRTLDISNCNITYLPEEAFLWTKNITKLNMAGNKINSSEENLNFLKLLGELEELDLRYNNLTSLSPKIFANNPKITLLRLVGNPWKCNCDIAHLWDWARLEKGDLGILEGGTTSHENVAVGGTKRKRGLTCRYDSDQPMPLVINKTTAGRRPFTNPARVLTSTNRTWAKYVRESGCEPAAKLLRPIRSVDAETMEMEAGLAARSHGPNLWATAAVNAIIVYTVLMTGLGVAYCIHRRDGHRRLVLLDDTDDDKQS